ncbi:MAG TPA: TAT-variant-translocated molybdopterin oxidoreductase, partial [Rhodothermales bacterium]|nr:TAT-variant-translocated molybdopterin oxidoreductase [Rhodothermales bacterium]
MIELPIVDTQAPANETPDTQPKQRLWRSMADLRKDKDYQDLAQHEFMPGAAETPKGASRRQFMQLMGASMAMAGLTACRRPVEKILPYTRKPEEIIPGIPLFYATAMPFRGVLLPLLVESHEGRPTKVEGNPDHPGSRGGTGLFEQVSVLNLYDPDRSTSVLHNGSEASWNDFVSFSQSMAANAAGRRMVVLSEETSSPTAAALRQQLTQRFPQLRWITYRAEGDDPVQLGMQQAFGRPLRPDYRFSQAEVIVSLDADFLGATARNATEASREFADGRRLESADDTMSRLYVVESHHTSTGAMADNRLRLRSSEIPAFAAALASRLGAGGGSSAFANHPYIAAMAEDLQAAGANGVVLAGETQPPEVHALCAAINSALGSVGTTMLLYDTGLEPVRPQTEEMSELVRDMTSGNIDTLLCLGVNPVYDAPAGVDFAAAMNSVGETIHVGPWLDETAQAASWHIPRAHYLEAWGDGRSYNGTLSVIQPLIAPLYDDAKSDIEILNLLATGLDQAGYDLVRNQWRTAVSGDFEKGWRKALHDGFLANTAYAPTTAAATAPSLGSLPTLGEDELELVFRLDPTVFDGTYANNAWCQEMPDPSTKLVWDNVALMSPATAGRLGLEVDYHKGVYHVDMVTLTVGGASIDLPVWTLPGHANNSISVTMGYGRNIQSDRDLPEDHFFDTDYDTNIYAKGPLANGVGANVAKIRPAMSTTTVTGVEVTKTGERYKIVTTQEHGAINIESRPLYRMATYDEYKQNPAFVEDFEAPTPGEPFEEYPPLWESRHPEASTAMKDNPYYRNQWGMVIDLNACSGCNACIAACSIENNVQVVGKEYVGQGR